MSNQLQITGGAKVRNLDGVITGTVGVLSSVPLGAANGVATLDSSGKVPVSQLPASVVTYLGTWDASTNTPTLTNGVGDAGDMYLCNVAGTVNFGAGPITFAVGDWVLYGSGTWQKSNGQNGTVTSVAVTESSAALNITGSPITTAGTINIGFAGTSAQYVAGDGSLITFPTIVSEAQNLITDVYNETGATLTKGTVVYINGGHGNLPTVTKAIATSDATSAQTYGVVQADITNNNNGHVVVIGSLGDLDTQAYAAGTQLYLSSTTAGAWTSTKQYAPAHLVYVGIVVRSHPTQGVVDVRIQNGFELDELHNVSAQTPSNNDGLFYNSSNSLWENKSIATALGYTPANDSLVVHLAGAETITGAKTFTANNLFTTYPARFTQGVGISETASYGTISGYTVIAGATNGLALYLASGGIKTFAFTSGTSNNTFTFPNSTGTVALTSDLTGGTVTSVGLSAPTGFSVSGSPVTTSGTLALSFAAGYSLPTTASQSNWDTAYSLRITSASSPLNITSNVLSISQATTSTNGYLSSTDWNTFNGKQNALTNPVTGTGTSGQVSYFNGTSTITGSNNFKFDGTNLLLGNPASALANLYLYNSSAAASFLLHTNSSTDYSEIAVRNNASTATSYFRQYSTAATGSDFGISRAGLALFFSNYATNFAIGTRNGGDLILGTADTERARLLASNGYFGIGTSSPSYLLDVNGTGRFSGNLNVLNTSSTVSVIATGINSGATGGSSIIAGTTGVTNIAIGNRSALLGGGYDATAMLYWGNGGNLVFNNGTDRFTMTSSGAATFSSSVTANTTIGVVNNGAQGAVLAATSNYADGYRATLQLSNTYTGGRTYQIVSTNNSDGFFSGGRFAFYDATSSTNLGYWDATHNFILNPTSGNVGIGTTSPASQLEVTTGSSGFRFFTSTSTQAQMNMLADLGSGMDNAGALFAVKESTNNAYLGFWNKTAGSMTEKMRITSGGNVGIGTSSPSSAVSGSAKVLAIVDNTTSNVSSFRAYGGGTASSIELYAANSEFGLFGNTNTPMLFYTNATERMRITSGGELYWQVSGTSGGSLNGGGVLFRNNSGKYIQISTGVTTDSGLIYFYKSDGAGGVTNTGSITTSGNMTLYNVTSDYRLKQDFKEYNGLDLVSSIKTYDFQWNIDKSRMYGVIAHELQKVIPYAVSGEKDAEEMQQVDYSKLVPILVKAIQELKQEIDELKNK